MKNFCHVILYGFLFLFFTSCKKDEPKQQGFNGHVVFTSQLKDEKSQAPVTQAALVVYRTPVNADGTIAGPEKLFATDTVDDNGMTKIEFDATQDYEYVARAQSFNPLYNFMNDPDIDPDFHFRKEGNINHNFKLHRAGWARVNIKNVASQNKASFMALTSSDPKPFVAYNLTADTTFLLRVFSGGDTKMHYKVDNVIDSTFKWTVMNWDTINFTLKY